MTIQPPTNIDLIRAFPSVTDLQLIKTGGFKAVYRAVIDGHPEALKIVQLPPSSQDEMGQGFRKEAVARVRREVEALAVCQVPELVRLASIPAAACRIAEVDYVVYSEEFLAGKDLWDLLLNEQAYPNEDELKLLFACLIRAVRELWQKGYIH